MSSIAELTEKLRQNDSEKTQIEQDIENIKGYQEDGFVGKVRIQVKSSYTLSENSEIVISADPDQVSTTPVVIKTLDEEVSLDVKSRSLNLTISVLNPSASGDEDIETSGFNIAELPDEVAAQFPLEISNNPDKRIVLKAGYDDYDDLLISKEAELVQIAARLSELKVAIKEASLAKPSTTKKNIKKGGKVSKDKKVKRKPVEEEIATDSDVPLNENSALTTFSQTALVAAQSIVSFRGYLIFGVASAAIFFYGDMASV